MNARFNRRNQGAWATIERLKHRDLLDSRLRLVPSGRAALDGREG